MAFIVRVHSPTDFHENLWARRRRFVLSVQAWQYERRYQLSIKSSRNLWAYSQHGGRRPHAKTASVWRPTPTPFPTSRNSSTSELSFSLEQHLSSA